MNIYSLPPLIVAICAILLGLLILSNNRKSSANLSFSLLCLTTFVWQFSWFVLFNIADRDIASIIVKIGYSGIIFIPITFYQFSERFTNIKFARYISYVSYLIGLVFLYFLWATTHFIDGYYKYFWGYYPKAGFLHPLYLVLLFTLCFLCWVLFILQLNIKPNNPIKNTQVRYLIWALIIYVPAATDFIVNYGIEFYPFGYISVILSLGIIAYAIVRHRLMDIQFIIKKGIVYSALVAVIIGLYSALLLVIQQVFQSTIGVNQWLATVITAICIAAGFRPLEIVFTNFTDKVFFKAKYNYQRTLAELSKGMAELTNLDRLTTLVAKIVVRNMKLEGSMLFVYDYRSNNFNIVSAQGNMKGFRGLLLPKDDPLIKRLDQTEDVIIKEEFVRELENKQLISSVRNEIKDIIKQMTDFKAVLCVPSKIKGKLIGFIMLSDKKSQDAYSTEDLMLFATLAPQAAVAIKNAMTYDEIRKELEKEHGKVEAIEKQLERSERLASLGTLVAGVAHEIRNPMQALRLKAEGILEKADDPGYVKEAGDSVIKNADRILTITKEMLEMSKIKEPEKKPVNLIEIIENVLKLMPVKADIKLIKDLNPVLSVNGNAVQLSQVVINLAQNAIKAMPNGGTLTIKTFQEDNFAGFEVADTGIGIPKENLEKIFDPFFTTYAENTGLGLSISNKIITDHGGMMKVKSEAGKGSVFSVILPSAQIL